MRKRDRPVVIKRVVAPGGHGHHGGAWKVAYADFVTALMAFFLLLWLISSADEETLVGLAQYFSDAKMNTGASGGVGGVLEGLTITPEIRVSVPSSPFNMQPTLPFRRDDQPETDLLEPAFAEGAEGGAELAGRLDDEALARAIERREIERFEEAADALDAALEADPDLAAFRDQLRVDRTPEGLRIQILDRDGSSMFPVGSDRMYPHTRTLLDAVVAAVATLPNRVSIRGHTDSLPYAATATYDNWRLSSDRANATRQVMVAAGLPAGRVVEVVGKGDGEPLDREEPRSARNRRISIVLLHEPPDARETRS